jgi:hypothetical protein
MTIGSVKMGQGKIERWELFRHETIPCTLRDWLAMRTDQLRKALFWKEQSTISRYASQKTAPIPLMRFMIAFTRPVTTHCLRWSDLSLFT